MKSAFKKRKNFIFLLLLILGSQQNLKAQNYNQWIEFGKEYFKVGVEQNGLYRISYNDLKDAGMNVDIINPQLLQLYYRGKEMAIFVEGEADGFFNQGDYIEFYGKRNDGFLDTQMYEDPNAQTNPYHNLYSNTSYYFVTLSTTDAIKGKRIPTLTPTDNGLSPEAYHTQTEIREFHATTVEEYSRGKFSVGPLYPLSLQDLSNQGALISSWVIGKGHTDNPFFGDNTKVDYAVPVKNLYPNGAAPILEVRITGRANTFHNIDILVGATPSTQRVVGNLEFSNYENKVYSTSLNIADVTTDNDTIFVSYQIRNVSNTKKEYVALAAITLSYPQKTDVNSESRKIIQLRKPANQDTKVLLENVPQNARLFDITDEYSMISVGNTIASGNMTATLLPIFTLEDRRLLIESETKNIKTIEKVNIIEIKPQDYNYLIVTHKSLLSAAQQYADYRSSEAGGNHQVLVADIDNLYAQFSYGEITPLAIRKFAEFMLSSGFPEYLFFIGKSLDISYEYENSKPESLNWEYQNLIPCYGKPCSDNAFTQGLRYTMDPYEPAIPTGRISVIKPQQVISYLNKTIEHESFQYDDLWKKRLLHLSGGINPNEQQQFRNIVDNLASIAANGYLGGKTQTITKLTTNASEFIDISTEVNKGLAMVTFFGHSSSTVSDIDFGEVSNPTEGFDNQGKYPMLLLNGCNAGDIFGRFTSLGEDWTLTPNKGAIAYLAHSALGFITPQNVYSQSVYTHFFTDSARMYQPMGKILKQHLLSYLQNPRTDIERARANVQQFVLQGDPAIRLFNMPKPDYAIDATEIFIDEDFLTERLTAQIDSFQLKVAISNFGRTDDQSIDVFIQRYFTNGENSTYGPFEIQQPNFKDTVSFVIYNTETDKLRGVGNNTFEVIIDAQQRVDELSESNNIASFDFFFPRGTMAFIVPQKFGIATQQPFTFFAQNTDPKSPNRNYSFQLDTAQTFDSPYFRDTTVFAGLTPKWTTSFISDNPTDSTVYYARVRVKEFTALDDTLWSETSFLYKKQSDKGWSQSHYQQLQKTTTNNLLFDETIKRFRYKIDTTKIVVKTSGLGDGDQDINYSVAVNDFEIVKSGECSNLLGLSTDIIMLLAFDQFTGERYVTQGLKVPSGAGGDTDIYCGFGSPGSMAVINSGYVKGVNALQIFLNGLSNDSFIKDGDYVLLVASGGFDFDGMDNVVAAFEQIGIDGNNITNVLQTGNPYIAFGRNKIPNSAIEILPDFNSTTPPNYQTLEAEFSVISTPNSASMLSPRIGPAKEWKKLYNYYNSTTNTDSVTLSLIGLGKEGGKGEIIQGNIPKGEIDISNIDIEKYPYLQLKSELFDSLLVPIQIDSWGITFDEVPEGILFFDSLTAELKNDITLQEGDTIQYFFRFENATASAFEQQIIVQYSLFNIDTRKTAISFDTLTLLEANAILKFNTKPATLGWVGKNRLTINVNPLIQTEQLYDNNILELNFEVTKDNTNPLLDVLFDGTHILDGDIVSPEPLITISLLDENQFLLKEDTLGMEILLRECAACEFERISFSSPDVTYGRVKNGNSKSETFQIDYNPKNLEDNVYTLRIKAQDATGNQAGVTPYQVNFEVINKSKITHFYPYPNPFSESVRFVFTLTGNVIPNEIKIQIMTVTGRVVREIMQDEIGALKIGNNITQYAWDGKDEFGSQLANGVYLYRVIVQSDGQGFERFQTKGDNMFKQGFGKMYLLR